MKLKSLIDIKFENNDELFTLIIDVVFNREKTKYLYLIQLDLKKIIRNKKRSINEKNIRKNIRKIDVFIELTGIILYALSSYY